MAKIIKILKKKWKIFNWQKYSKITESWYTNIDHKPFTYVAHIQKCRYFWYFFTQNNENTMHDEVVVHIPNSNKGARS